MKIPKRSGNSGDNSAMGEVTRENYKDRAASFISGHGGEGFVIRALDGTDGAIETGKPATEAQWVAWMRYFSAKNISHVYAVSCGLATVPAEWPENFDVDAAPSDTFARLRQPLRRSVEIDSVQDGYRRKTFIAQWRQDQALAEAEIASGRIKLEDLDARHCKGELKTRVVAAIEVKLEALKAEAQSADLRLSERALHAIQRGHMDTGNAL